MLTFEEPTPTPVKEPTDEEILEVLRNASPEQREAMWATMRTFLPVKRLTKLDPEIAKLLAQKRTATNGGVPIGGGLPFELQARKALADILVGAIKDAKKRLAKS